MFRTFSAESSLVKNIIPHSSSKIFHKPEKFENMRCLFCFQAQELLIVNWLTFSRESPKHYFLRFLILRDFFRSFITLYKMRYYFCELFYHLSVKNLQEQSSLPSYVTSTICKKYGIRKSKPGSVFLCHLRPHNQRFAQNRERQVWKTP